MKSARWIWVIGVCVLAFAVNRSDAQQRSAASPAMSQQQVQAVLTEYCITCHNQQQKTGSLELDTKDLAHLDRDVVAWESVVRKLRTGMMPPKSVKRADRATLDNVALWL